MVDEDDDDSRAKLHAGISSALDNNEVLAGWVCISEIFDEDGERGIWIENDDMSTPWNTIGLLEYAIEDLKTRVRVMKEMSMHLEYMEYDEDDESI